MRTVARGLPFWVPPAPRRGTGALHPACTSEMCKRVALMASLLLVAVRSERACLGDVSSHSGSATRMLCDLGASGCPSLGRLDAMCGTEQVCLGPGAGRAPISPWSGSCGAPGACPGALQRSARTPSCSWEVTLRVGVQSRKVGGGQHCVCYCYFLNNLEAPALL